MQQSNIEVKKDTYLPKDGKRF